MNRSRRTHPVKRQSIVDLFARDMLNLEEAFTFPKAGGKNEEKASLTDDKSENFPPKVKKECTGLKSKIGEADTSDAEGLDLPLGDEEEDQELLTEPEDMEEEAYDMTEEDDEEEAPPADDEEAPEEAPTAPEGDMGGDEFGDEMGGDEMGGEDLPSDTLDITTDTVADDELGDEALPVDDGIDLDGGDDLDTDVPMGDEDEDIIEVFDDEISIDDEEEDKDLEEPYMESIVRPLRKLVAHVSKLGQEVSHLRSRLNETELFNHKLVVTNRLLADYRISDARKASLVKRIDEARSIRAVDDINTVIREAFSMGDMGQTVTEILSRGRKRTTGSSSKVLGSGIPDSEVKRMQKLAGITDDATS